MLKKKLSITPKTRDPFYIYDIFLIAAILEVAFISRLMAFEI